jgi:hypothetical protein
MGYTSMDKALARRLPVIQGVKKLSRCPVSFFWGGGGHTPAKHLTLVIRGRNDMLREPAKPRRSAEQHFVGLGEQRLALVVEAPAVRMRS